MRTVIATRDFSEGLYLVQATKGGIVKKTLFKEYDTPRKSDGIIAINIREGDELIGVRLTSGEDDVLLTSRKGQTVRFDENEARAMGRATGGVIGMKLRKGDEVIAIDVADDDGRPARRSPRTATASARASPTTRARAAARWACSRSASSRRAGRSSERSSSGRGRRSS